MFSKIFSDIILVYKNFLHWNISKIIISVSSFFFWVLLALPFVILTYVIAYFWPIEWKTLIQSFYLGNSFDFLILSIIAKHLFYFILIVFLSLFSFAVFLLGSSYKYPLISKLYLSYIDWEKRNYFAGNDYFSFKKLWKYTILISWAFIYILAPFVIFILLFFIIVLLFWWFDSISAIMMKDPINIFSIILLLFFILLIISFFYIIYRVQFAFFSFIDNKYFDTKNNALFFIKNSISQTKSIKLLWKYLIIILSLIIFFSPFLYLESQITWTRDELNLLVLAKTDTVFSRNMDDDNKYKVSLLEKKYINLNDEDLKYELTKYNAYSNLWALLYFIFLWNIETMLFVSFYRRALIWDKEIIEE